MPAWHLRCAVSLTPYNSRNRPGAGAGETWQCVVAAADLSTRCPAEPQTERSRSIRRMMSQMTYLRAKARFTQLADAETCWKMDAETNLNNVEGDWRG